MIVLFTLAAFLSAALVFMIQPMVAKAMLPTFGGTPQVWTVSMLFFQGALLVGYGYAHMLTRRLRVRRQALAHVVVLLLPVVALPIALRGANLAPGFAPAVAVLLILSLSVGLPYVVVAATSPLIQRWFSGTRHRHAADPYFLYAAGNAGSLLGLLAYPFLIEPNLRLADQGLLWSIGYAGFVAVCALCAVVLARGSRAPATDVDPVRSVVDASESPPTWARRTSWVIKAFIPSSLLLGVTAHVQTDIAAVPLLWVIPLSLYLLTFVIAFSPRRPFGPNVAARLLPFAVVLVLLSLLRVLPIASWLNIGIHDLAFFLAAMLAHGRLADERPSPADLTGYYLLLAVGGVLGGLFNALVAPAIFDQLLEYPAMLVVALALVRPTGHAAEWRIARSVLIDLVVGAMFLLAVALGLVVLQPENPATWVAVVGVATLITIRRPLRFATAVGLVLALTFLSSGGGLFADRTFFGVNRVIDDGEGRHVYLSGATVHGVQHAHTGSPAGGPLAYYHPTGPAGQVLSRLRGSREVRDVAVVGLGAGSLAAYSEPGQTMTFFEIDPVVIEIARDPKLFTFLADAPGDVMVVEGDGRLKVGELEDASLDLLVLDAFSSDAIPAHIVTREAFELYLRKLRPNGLLLANVSNAYLDVRAVVVASGLANGLDGLAQSDADLSVAPRGDKEVSSWVVLGRAADLDFLRDDSRWVPIASLAPGRLWTDDFSDILSVIR